MILSPIALSGTVFACAFGGALIGVLLHPVLPEDHLSQNSREAVRLGMGLVATTVALVLGLLIASAKGFYDTGNSEVTELAADTVMVDRVLLHYGPEANQIRTALRSSLEDVLQQAQQGSKIDLRPGGLDALYDRVQSLSPANESQQRLQLQAEQYAIQIGHIRWLMFEQRSVPLPWQLLATLIFWLSGLFISFGLFARPNVTVLISQLFSALAVAGAVYLIADMYQPYGGFIQISLDPLRVALSKLAQ